MELGLKDKVALVTGTAGRIGMGRNIALTLAKEGCHIVSADVDLPGAKQTTDEITILNRKAFAAAVDVSNQLQVNDMVRAAIAELGRIDILVNTAGGTSSAGPLHQAQEAKWEKDININFLGSM